MSQILDKVVWLKVARRRRLFLILVILSTTLVACWFMANILPHKGTNILELAMVIVFGALFAWISIGFWMAIGGFLTLLKKYDRFAITSNTPLNTSNISSRTAILIPICNEDIARVFTRLRVVYQSLKSTGKIEHFDFFILSDSTDPDNWVEEEAAWA
ncbi:MAG: glucan biosynthesis glucosyltransferase H, partial [Desulfobacterota bacterium]|nr:glucan biosynthesis glucosyltransferase H [Thermodesulfobacteriota bacterium]